MDFYNRTKELEEIHRIQNLAFTQNSRMLVLTGRRRIGKTSLIKQATKDSDTIYLFVGRKAEAVLVETFSQQVRDALNVFVPSGINNFKDFFQYLFEIGKQRPFNLIVDEFQEFQNINPSVFSDLQFLWDEYRKVTKMFLVISGSVYCMMQKIFTDSSEPLFGRADNIMKLFPFKISVMKQILADYNPESTNEDLLALYTITGGIPKYIEMFCDNQCLTKEKMYRFFFSENSPFIDEGRNLLINEFGKNYGTYFSILQEIAKGKRTQNEIETALGGIPIGGHLTKLEEVYCILKRERPIFAKIGSKKNVRYLINDCFLNFWFRYIEQNRTFIELGNYDDLLKLVSSDYTTYTGHTLELYFRQKMAEEGGFKEIGGWWNIKTGAQKSPFEANEIDIVGVQTNGKSAFVAEVKRNKQNYNHELFMSKVKHLQDKELSAYKIETRLLTIEEM
ncbi:MAG TPA: ATP-binding protein [Paludibacteraceae bacterium]|nr:ATP-binding protein [Paludibacteraceae bacterium]HOU67119.1 ATP-binding protein [Paludibacteraceae bacterium]HQF49291.1 ATP-binding protein [Paludibacteraceae bacterium]